MSFQEVPLNRILPNPYQTREGEDPEHIRQLAQSIQEQGLLQIPVARIMPGEEGLGKKDVTYQLAFGHSRLAAFRLLASTGLIDFARMPLNVMVLNDNQLFEMAVAENLERKDLTPIEEAKAMQRYMVEFQKTSAEVGELFHLSDSAVRNKLRLLGLPADLQEGLREGKITEGAGRELLTWLELPQEFRKEHTQSWDHRNEPDYDPIIEAAVKGSNAENIRNKITDVMERGRNLSKASWKWDEKLEGEGIVGFCKGCPMLFTRDNSPICTNEKCFKAKEIVWRRQYLQQASLLSGIHVLEEEKDTGSYYSLSQFSTYNSSDLQTLKNSRQGACENLRLVYEDNSYVNDKETHLSDIGFPCAMILCGKRSGFCTCKKAVEQGVSLQVDAGGKLDDSTLKEINRQRRVQEKLDRDFVDAMEAKTAAMIYEAMNAGNAKVWLKIAHQIDFGLGNDLENRKVDSVEIIKQAICQKLAARNRYNSDPKHMLKEFNAALAKLDLEPLPWEIEPEEPLVGKTLMEVFHETLEE